MSEPRQLPGPYIADHGDGESFARATSGTPLYVARFEGPDHAANCDLFVAAPEAFEVCQAVVEQMNAFDPAYGVFEQGIIRMAQAVLAKAERCK